MLSLLVIILAFGGNAAAQEQDRGVTFRLQPGMVTTEFISTKATSSATGFNFRFTTLLSTGRWWIRPIFGVNLIPYGTTGLATSSSNAPGVFIGNAFKILPAEHAGDWFSMEIPVLLYYSYGGGGRRNEQTYGRDVYLEISVTSPIGTKLLSELGSPWKHVSVYGALDQNLTPNTDVVSGRTDRFNPVALYGISIFFGSQP